MNIIRELRKKKGIQQKELAIAIGVSRPTVSEWESNKKDPSGERLKKLAEYFGVDELVILGRDASIVKESGQVTESEQILQDLIKKLTMPRTIEAKIVSFGMDQLPKEEREKILAVLQAMYMNNPDLFRKESNDET